MSESQFDELLSKIQSENERECQLDEQLTAADKQKVYDYLYLEGIFERDIIVNSPYIPYCMRKAYCNIKKNEIVKLENYHRSLLFCHSHLRDWDFIYNIIGKMVQFAVIDNPSVTASALPYVKPMLNSPLIRDFPNFAKRHAKNESLFRSTWDRVSNLITRKQNLHDHTSSLLPDNHLLHLLYSHFLDKISFYKDVVVLPEIDDEKYQREQATLETLSDVNNDAIVINKDKERELLHKMVEKSATVELPYGDADARTTAPAESGLPQPVPSDDQQQSDAAEAAPPHRQLPNMKFSQLVDATSHAHFVMERNEVPLPTRAPTTVLDDELFIVAEKKTETDEMMGGSDKEEEDVLTNDTLSSCPGDDDDDDDDWRAPATAASSAYVPKPTGSYCDSLPDNSDEEDPFPLVPSPRANSPV